MDLSYPYNKTKKQKNSPFAPESQTISKDDFNDYMNEIKPENYVSHRKLICDWTEE